ncbi:MAG: ATP-binding protein [Eubacteriales bacterium]|nr:ATP-binding protein [Eubacteriales bacterium]MDD3350009.1 ATP-binding protein [Eubacteriales bacterium]
MKLKPGKGKVRKSEGNPKKRKKTTQNALPFDTIYEDGTVLLKKNQWSKTIEFEDINYQTARRDEQESMFNHYCDLLNTFPSSVGLQITIQNCAMDKEAFRKNILLPEVDDAYSGFRREWNQMLSDKLEEGKSNMQKKKSLTFTVEANDKEQAQDTFGRLTAEAATHLKKIGSQTKIRLLDEQMEVLHNVLRPENVGEFQWTPRIEQKKRGTSIKDAIAPDGLEYKRDHFMIGNQYAQVLYIKELPTFLSDQILTDLTDLRMNLMLSVHLRPLEPDQALKLVRKKITSMESNKMERQKKSIKGGFAEAFIPFHLQNALEEAKELLDDIVNKDQKLFLTSILIFHMAESKEALQKNQEMIVSAARKKLCQVGVLQYQQEEAFASVLPLGINTLRIDRCLTTDSTAIFVPFASQELMQPDGKYYGQNDVSGNLLLFNRLSLKTPSGFILGTPGSGKSFKAKEEMVNVLLSTDDDVIIIDPEREYTKLVENFQGEVIQISAASKNYINPLDINLNYADDDDPLRLKSDFLLSFCEVILAGREGLTQTQKSIIDRCMRLTYMDLLQHDFDPAHTPTLADFGKIMREQKEEEAQGMATALELYTQGSLSVFSNRTNIDVNSRLICYDTKDLGKQLKSMGMLIVLDQIWNRVSANRQKGKRTWLYIDEMYIFFTSEYLATYFDEVYRRFRKWGGVPTGVTQNIRPMLESSTARTMIDNSDFIVVMNQSKSDRDALAELLKISDSLLDYITNAEEGYGLLSVGKSIIPFRDKFPKKTQLYRMMTTKVEEIKPREASKSWSL